MNLFDRRIHRLRLSDGAHLGSFSHGAATEPWADNARVYGLGISGSTLYHGLVNSMEDASLGGEFEARVYTSRFDGGEMREVLRFPLGYREAPAWRPWSDAGLFAGRIAEVVQPILADIEFDRTGLPLIGLRSRNVDLWSIPAAGDVLRGVTDGAGGWRLASDTDPFEDDTIHGEDGMGGLAALLETNRLVAGIASPLSAPGSDRGHAGAVWLSLATGAIEGPFDGREPIAIPRFASATTGDIETLCAVLPTATPSPSTTPSSSPTPSPSTTPTPSKTPTPAPLPIYLPLALGERCTPEIQRIDVALVIDASSSMRELTVGGRSKIDAALAAVGVFLAQLRLEDGDQAAIIAFHREADRLQPLTADRRALDAALERIEIDTTTCIVCGMVAADEELSGPRRKSSNVPVLILLTDGRSNPRPVSEAVVRAAQAKERGIVVFTIGLGDDLDSEALAHMASRLDYYHHAPDAEALEEIYRSIAVSIPCPAGSYWGGQRE